MLVSVDTCRNGEISKESRLYAEIKSLHTASQMSMRVSVLSCEEFGLCFLKQNSRENP